MNQLPHLSLATTGTPAVALPERVLQFGTGVLLRGLVDVLIDSANRQGVFNGSVVAVDLTRADVSDFARQDNQYTVWVRGLEAEKLVDSQTVVSAISRVLAAQTEWADVLTLARKPSLQIIISDTTEAGSDYVEESIFGNGTEPPVSFPARLTAFLYERFKNAGGSRKMGLVVVPTEAVPDNGLRLRDAVERTARHNELGKLFMKWLKFHVRFCNSLVDRIVTKQPDPETVALFEEHAGYTDALLITTEPYHLWAIEGDERVRKVLSFADVSPKNIVIDEDINFYRERKLRLLNGTHTLVAPLSYLLGNLTLADTLNHPHTGPLLTALLHTDLVPTVPTDALGDDGPTAVQDFATQVLDRFKNPHNEQFLLTITTQQTAKMRVRNVPALLFWGNTPESISPRMALCLAAYLRFMRPAAAPENGEFRGEITLPGGGELVYPIRDEQADFFYGAWADVSGTEPKTVAAFVTTVLANQSLWQTDLTAIPGLAGQVAAFLTLMLDKGVETAVRSV